MTHCPQCNGDFEPPGGSVIPYTCPHCGSQVVGRYCDLSLIGNGAMGNVYRGRQPDMGNRPVAVKIPKTAEPQVRRRFERETAAAGSLRHENIVCAYDCGEERQYPYLVLEFVAGSALSDVVASEHPLSPQRVAQIVRQIAAGLEHAQKHQIVNRDIKPDNVLLAQDGTAKILDYGLASIGADGDHQLRVTRSGAMLGTPGFLAPEQARDPHSVTIAADIYSLGCTAYFLLTRRTPFAAADAGEILRRHAQDPRPSVLVLRPDAGRDMDELIGRMMSIDPQARPSPAQVGQTLTRLIPHLSSEPPPPTAAGGGTPDRIDVACPQCGELYHLRPEAQGKPWLCRNKLCGNRFVVPQGAAALGLPAAGTASAAVAFAPSPATAAGLIYQAEVAEAEIAEAEIAEPQVAAAEIPYAALDESASTYNSTAPNNAPQIVEATIDDSWAGPAAVPPVVPATAVSTEAGAPPSSPTGSAPPDSIPVLPSSAVTALPPKATVEATPGFASKSLPVPRDSNIEMLPASFVVALPSSQTSSPANAAATPPSQTGSHREGNPPPVAVPGKATAGTATRAPARGKSRKARRTRLTTLVMLGLVVFLSAAGSALLVLDPWGKEDSPTARWQEVQTLYTEHKWTRAQREFDRFQQQYPEDAHVTLIPYFLAMCEAGEDIFSQTGDPERGLESAQRIYREHRDNPAYRYYVIDFYNAMRRLMERFLDRAEAQQKMEPLASARQAETLMRTAAESLTGEQYAWVPEQTGQLAQRLVAVERQLQENLARTEMMELLQSAQQATEPEFDADAVYARVDTLWSTYPKLAADAQVLAARDQAVRAEAGRIRYHPVSADPAPSAEAAEDRPATMATLVVVWDQPAGSATEPTPQRIVALARGVMYVFDAQGNLQWARRLGIDSLQMPLYLPALAPDPERWIATSAEDNAVLALEAATGRQLWQFRVHSELSAPLTLVQVAGPTMQVNSYGLLPTVEGQIHVVEMNRGQRVGHFEVGLPLTVGGSVDEATGLVYFPVESRRLLAIDPRVIQQPDLKACPSLLHTQHAAGAVRSEPVIVDQYLVLCETSELDQMRLRTFQVSSSGFGDPRAVPVRELSLRGWSWFAPRSTPDRLTLVTDEGELGLFGLNLDFPEEAIYPLITGSTARLSGNGRLRAMAVHADEHLLWVMAGGQLQKLSLDLLRQQVRKLLPTADQPAAVTGIPLHEPQLDSSGKHLYLTTMAADGGQYQASCVDAESLQPVWQRQLGLNLWGDPILAGSRVLLLDRSGRTLVVDEQRDQVPSGQMAAVQTPATGSIPPEADPRRWWEVNDERGGRYLVLAGKPGQETHVAVAAIATAASSTASGPSGQGTSSRTAETDAAPPWSWQVVVLPEPLHGQPAVLEGCLIAPGRDGHLYRARLSSESLEAGTHVPWAWAGKASIGPTGATVVALAPREIAVLDADSSVRRLRLEEKENVWTWRPQGAAFDSPEPLQPWLLAWKKQLFVQSQSGRLLSLTSEQLTAEPLQWDLDGSITAGPVPRGDGLVAVVDQRKVVWIDPQHGGQPRWMSEPYSHRIRGMPTMLNPDLLLVADDGRQVSALNIASGSVAWNRKLPVRIGPAAAAVPFGKHRCLVPLTDGSLGLLDLPAAKSGNTELAP